MDVWMSELDDDVAPYLQPLLELLVPVLEGGSADLQNHLLSATAAAAAAAGHAFRPFLPALVPRLQRCLALTDNDHLKARNPPDPSSGPPALCTPLPLTPVDRSLPPSCRP